MRFPVFTAEIWGVFFTLYAKLPKFTYVKFEKKTLTFIYGTMDYNMYIKQVTSKLSNTLVLCYLAFDVFYNGFLVK